MDIRQDLAYDTTLRRYDGAEVCWTRLYFGPSDSNTRILQVRHLG